MPDLADMAQEHRDQLEIASIARFASRAAFRELQPIHRCHNCEMVIDAEQLFCDADCRNDWQAHERASQQKPRRD